MQDKVTLTGYLESEQLREQMQAGLGVGVSVAEGRVGAVHYRGGGLWDAVGRQQLARSLRGGARW